MVERLAPQDLLPTITVNGTKRLRVDRPDGPPVDIMCVGDHTSDMDPALLALSRITKGITAGRPEMSKVARVLCAAASTSGTYANMLETRVGKEFEDCRLAVSALSGLALGAVPLFVVAEPPNAHRSLFAVPFARMEAVRVGNGVGIEPAIRVPQEGVKKEVTKFLPQGFYIPFGLYYSSENAPQ